MNVTIKTKYDIGDIIYAVDHYYDYYASHTQYVITDIIVKIDSRDIRIMYCVECGERVDRFPEAWCFATYEECARWCEEHN